MQFGHNTIGTTRSISSPIFFASSGLIFGAFHFYWSDWRVVCAKFQPIYFDYTLGFGSGLPSISLFFWAG
jgi:hypothetical protein